MQVERERRRRRLVASATVPDRFGDWIAAARPQFQWTAPHFVAMQTVLDQVTAGALRRAFFQIPIRHGKTEHNTIGYGVYRLERDPRTRVLVASYNQKKANQFSRAMKRLALERGIRLSRGRDAMEEWETEAGGGAQFVGVGTGVAGVNADLIVIDDPIGGREEAESQAHRDRVWDSLTSDLLARSEPHTAALFTMSRWHQDDPAGRLRDGQAGPWHVLDLPGVAEAGDALGRPEGALLWPEFRGEEWMRQARFDLTEYGFASLVQGRPRPREGGMFKWAWWQLLEEIPAAGPMIRYWDLAGTELVGRGHDPDYSAGALACRMPDQRTALVDMARFRKSIAARDAALVELALEDRQRYGGRVQWWIETEAGIAGKDRTQALVRQLQAIGLAVHTEHPTGQKIHRAEPLAAMAEAGNVVLCPGPWRDPFRAEAADFPNGSHDDQIDAAAGAVSKLATPRIAAVAHLRI